MAVLELPQILFYPIQIKHLIYPKMLCKTFAQQIYSPKYKHSRQHYLRYATHTTHTKPLLLYNSPSKTHQTLRLISFTHAASFLAHAAFVVCHVRVALLHEHCQTQLEASVCVLGLVLKVSSQQLRQFSYCIYYTQTLTS